MRAATAGVLARADGSPQSAIDRRDTRNFLILMWAVAALSLGASWGINNLSTDDAMRLVEVRDFLSGQSWFDLTQYRLNPPAGVETHWSRLIDLPLALLIKGSSLALTRPMAEQAALLIWPTALLLAFLAGVSRLARELAGDTAARVAPVFAILMAPVTQHFRTGAIDHHNAQLTLTVWSMALVARLPLRTRDSAIAGALCALSVGIGQEMVPAIAGLAVVVALRWVFTGEASRISTVGYAVAFAVGTLLLAAATVPPARYLTVDCDAISIAQVGIVALGGLGLAALALVRPLDSPARRLTAAGGLAAALAVAVKLGAPQCLGDPYASLDPRLIELWLSSVSEGRNIASLARDMPEQIPAYFVIPCAAIILGALQCTREDGLRRWNWLACITIETIFVVLASWELRFAAGANAVGALLLPAALLRMLPAAPSRVAYFGIARPALMLMLVLNPVALFALGSGAAAALRRATPGAPRVAQSGDAGTCMHTADYAPLALLPRGRVLAFIDAGPFILMESGDAVLAAPYHRNAAGNLAMLDVFLGNPNAAKALLKARDISYLAFCPSAPERYIYAHAAPAGLAAALADGHAPDFLQRIALSDTSLVVYRVLR